MQYVYLEIISVLIPPFLVSVQSKKKGGNRQICFRQITDCLYNCFLI